MSWCCDLFMKWEATIFFIYNLFVRALCESVASCYGNWWGLCCLSNKQTNWPHPTEFSESITNPAVITAHRLCGQNWAKQGLLATGAFVVLSPRYFSEDSWFQFLPCAMLLLLQRFSPRHPCSILFPHSNLYAWGSPQEYTIYSPWMKQNIHLLISL